MKQSTLDEAVKITYKRCDGNTTRLVDNAIQILYSRKVCIAHDHFGEGKFRRSNEDLFKCILYRLECEHNLSDLIKNKKIRIDERKLEIQFI